MLILSHNVWSFFLAMADCISFNVAVAQNPSTRYKAPAPDGKLSPQFSMPDRLEELLCDASVETYRLLLKSCERRRHLAEGKRIHQHIVDSGHGDSNLLANFLVRMYGRCGSALDARAVFNRIKGRDVFSWTLMIEAYCQNGQNIEALQIFRQMDLEGEATPDRFVFTTVLRICSSLRLLSLGRQIHERVSAAGYDSEQFTATALINMYSKCGDTFTSRRIFDSMQWECIVTYNAMISAYAQKGHPQRAMEIFRKLELEGFKADELTFSALATAFANATASLAADARALHSRIIASGFDSLVAVSNPLMNMYRKHGHLREARQIFNKMPRKNLYSWNTMLAAYTKNGFPREAFDLLKRMPIPPNSMTFYEILVACKHAKLVDEACNIFHCMVSRFNIPPRREHFFCMLEILTNAGRLEEAEELMNRIPDQADPVMWRNLLCACRIHKDVDRAARVAEHLVRTDPCETGPYIILMNIYAAAGRLDLLDETRKRLKSQIRSSRLSGNGWFMCNNKFMAEIEEETAKLEAKLMDEKLQVLNDRMRDALQW